MKYGSGQSKARTHANTYLFPYFVLSSHTHICMRWSFYFSIVICRITTHHTSYIENRRVPCPLNGNIIGARTYFEIETIKRRVSEAPLAFIPAFLLLCRLFSEEREKKRRNSERIVPIQSTRCELAGWFMAHGNKNREISDANRSEEAHLFFIIID